MGFGTGLLLALVITTAPSPSADDIQFTPVARAAVTTAPASTEPAATQPASAPSSTEAAATLPATAPDTGPATTDSSAATEPASSSTSPATAPATGPETVPAATTLPATSADAIPGPRPTTAATAPAAIPSSPPSPGSGLVPPVVVNVTAPTPPENGAYKGLIFIGIAVCAVALSVLAVAATYLLQRNVIEPVREQKRLIGRIATAVTNYWDICLPEFHRQTLPEPAGAAERWEWERKKQAEEENARRRKQEMAEANNTLISLASELRATVPLIPFYDALADRGYVLSKEKIKEAAYYLLLFARLEKGTAESAAANLKSILKIDIIAIPADRPSLPAGNESSENS